MSSATQRPKNHRDNALIAALVLGIDDKLRAGILDAFHAAHANRYGNDKREFVLQALQNEFGSDVDLAARLGVTKSAISNWRKSFNIRADKLDLLIALADSHTPWPNSRDRYNHSILSACEFCRQSDLDAPSRQSMTLEYLECLRLVLSSKVWSESVIQRSRDEQAICDEARRICEELKKKGVQTSIYSLERIDTVVYDWLVPYLRCIYVIRGESAIDAHSELAELV